MIRYRPKIETVRQYLTIFGAGQIRYFSQGTELMMR